MATKITISNGFSVLLDNSYHIDWNDIGVSMPILSSAIHYVIWDGSKGEIQTKDADGNMAGNTDLTDVGDAVESTSVQALLTWGETRKGELTDLANQEKLEIINTWNRVRNDRNRYLMNSDWTVGSDSPLDSATKTQWETYRSKLRDIPADYSAIEPKLVQFSSGGTLQQGTGMDASHNLTGVSNVLVPPSDIFSYV